MDMSGSGAPSTYQPLILDDKFPGFPCDLFPLPEPCFDHVERLLIPHGMILEQTERVVKQFFDDWDGNPLVLIMVMNGAARFGELVIKSLNKTSYTSGKKKSYQIAYLQCINYDGDKQLNTNEEKLFIPPTFPSIKDKHVVFVEDIIDTGHSMCKLLSWAKTAGAKSAKCLSMTTKRTIRSNGYKPDYCCFEIYDHWVVGFGLDYNNHFRHFDHVYVLSEKGKIDLNHMK